MSGPENHSPKEFGWIDLYIGCLLYTSHLIRLMNMGCVDPLHGERDICTLDEDEITLRD